MEAIRFEHTRGKHRARWPRAFFAAAIGAALTLSACGGGDDNPTITGGGGGGTTTGKAAIAMGDAAGDFYSYQVTLTSLKLKPASGAEVETLPAPVLIDFTQLVGVSELMSMAGVPTGSYTGAHVVLDFSGANIIQPNASGAPTTLSPVDASGNPLTTLDFTVNFPAPVSITEGNTSSLSLDFDVPSSSIVEGSNVIVLPIMTASSTPDTARTERVQGQLASVSGSGASRTLTVNVQPLNHSGGDFGSVAVKTDANTVYDVNGSIKTGSAGATALAALTMPTPVLTSNDVAADGSLTAKLVRAGSSLGAANADEANGVVLARNGNTVTVLGAVRNNGTAARHFANNLQVDLTGADVAGGAVTDAS
ncbi:MAG TPA: DUF4382 domain-containing protein, partial [Nevskiaceae bacterium]|nr:DUF4382 domain-containing protein [Nevskiaceae bacterium]